MDTIVTCSSVLSFLSFIGILAFLFRVQKKHSPLVTVLVASIIGWCLLGVMLLYVGGYTLEEYVIAFGIYGLLVVLFVFAIFSVFEASLTVKFLSIIASHSGITQQYLEHNFGRSDIVKRRLERLLESGDIVKTNGGYQASVRQSFFRFREMFLEWYC